jgi:hypothetical protein
LIDTAAQAVLLGFGDPLPLLARGHYSGDWTVTRAVIDRAARLQGEIRSKELDSLARAIGAEVGNRLAKLFSA